MTTTRIIKKYPNRRLYDTEESRYITLADVRELVINGVDFSVIDKKSEADITRSILLQVIAEQESHGEPIMSRDFLAEVIRSYDKIMPGFLADYLEQSLQFFIDQHKAWRKQFTRIVGVDPIDVVSEITQQNINRFKALQDEVLSRFARSGAQSGTRNTASTADDTKKAG